MDNGRAQFGTVNGAEISVEQARMQAEAAAGFSNLSEQLSSERNPGNAGNKVLMSANAPVENEAANNAEPVQFTEQTKQPAWQIFEMSSQAGPILHSFNEANVRTDKTGFAASGVKEVDRLVSRLGNDLGPSEFYDEHSAMTQVNLKSMGIDIGKAA